MSAIIISGSLVYDHIMDFPDRFKNHILPESIHILNVCFTVEKMEKTKGGTAGNIAYNIKMLGGEPEIVSSVGRDGNEYVEYLEKLGIKTSRVNVDKKLFTASCFITTDRDDNQITAFHNGALGSASDIDVDKCSKKPGWAIVSPTKKEVMLKHLNQCAKAGIKIVLDPAQQIPSFSDEELRESIRKSDILVGNDYEIKMVKKRTGWSRAKFFENTEMVITTYGERGSRIDTRDGQEVLVEACRAKKVEDPTGAGDAYRAGLLMGLEKGYNLRMCGRLGSVAASFAIEKCGTQRHRFSLAEFSERYKASYKEDTQL